MNLNKLKMYVWAQLLVLSVDVQAVLPTAPSDLTDNNADWIKGLLTFIAPILTGILTLITGSGSSVMLYNAWDSFNQARRHGGGWGSFVATLIAGIVLLSFTIFIVTQFKDIFNDLINA